MYGYGIFFVCEITSGCRLEISTFGSQCSPSSTVANSRVLDAFIYLISTTFVEFMILLHAKKVFQELFMSAWQNSVYIFMSK